jgi:hypothetical protein
VQTGVESFKILCPRELLSQNESYLHGSFLIYCRFKIVQIMVHRGQEGPQYGEPY